jgi:hypothetical protein
VAQTANRKIQKLQIWVEYRFVDADRKGGGRVKVPILGVSDLLKLQPSMPAISPDLADGSPHSLHVEVVFEGGHSAYCEIGQLGGAFGGLSIALDEMLGTG